MCKVPNFFLATVKIAKFGWDKSDDLKQNKTQNQFVFNFIEFCPNSPLDSSQLEYESQVMLKGLLHTLL